MQNDKLTRRLPVLASTPSPLSQGVAETNTATDTTTGMDVDPVIPVHDSRRIHSVPRRLGQRDALIHRSLIAVAPAPFQSSAGGAMDTTSNGSNLTGSTSAQRRVLGDDQGPQVPRRSMRGSYQRVSIDNCFYSCHSLTFLEEQPCLRHAHHF